jgi:hypothetical protein
VGYSKIIDFDEENDDASGHFCGALFSDRESDEIWVTATDQTQQCWVRSNIPA